MGGGGRFWCSTDIVRHVSQTAGTHALSWVYVADPSLNPTSGEIDGRVCFPPSAAGNENNSAAPACTNYRDGPTVVSNRPMRLQWFAVASVSVSAATRLAYDMICILVRTYADLTFFSLSKVYDLFQLLCVLSSVLFCILRRIGKRKDEPFSDLGQTDQIDHDLDHLVVHPSPPL